MQSVLDMPVKNKRQRILYTLIKAKEGQKHYFHGEVLPIGYVPLKEIVIPTVGGTSAPRRIREMREFGIDIRALQHVVNTPEGAAKRTWCYVLKTEVAIIDQKKCKIKQNSVKESA